MKQYVELRDYQLVSSYGGVGSIIETLSGALLVLSFDQWLFYRFSIEKADAEDLKKVSVDDPRLIARIRHDFPNLEHLIQIPENTLERGGTRVAKRENIVSAAHFPTWFYCPKCNNFMEIARWNEAWKAIQPRNYDRDKHYTSCPFCSSFTGKRTRLVDLEQVRFIQISEKGDIRDFPWREWFDNVVQSSECASHRLKYKPSPFSENFESIHISCQDCKKATTLRGIFSYPPNSEFRTVLRSSNNVYFPRIISSILIPGAPENVAEDDNMFKHEEFEQIVSMVSEGDYHDEDLYLKRAGKYGDIQVVAIRDMTMSSVLCSYTRGLPLSTGKCYVNGRSKHVTKWNEWTKYLPAVKSAGEGFLLIFNDILIKEWFNLNKDKNRFMNAIIRTLSEADKSFYGTAQTITKNYDGAKLIILHTLSHLLMKQLEYTCGYPATSLNERVYTSGDGQAGIMIYSITGSEGSYGGLVGEAESGALSLLFENAITSAKFCRSDPVCYESGSVCFSCSLIPETSCEMSNRYLDRSLVVDPDYGFWEQLKTCFPQVT